MFPLQAPATSVDIFGNVAQSHTVAPPIESVALAPHSLQNLQDLAMMGFSDQKRYKVLQPV